MKKFREIAEQKGVFFGAAVDCEDLKQRKMANLLASQCSIIVPENGMKWDTIHPLERCYNFKEADRILRFAEVRNLKVRGHTLCWHLQNPAWLKQRLRRATCTEATKLLEAHIYEVVGRYAGRIHSWDVVNEAIDVSSERRDALRGSPWLRAIGPKYIEIAFRAAAKADPKALLTYNDYGLEGDSAKNEQKKRRLVKLIESMLKRNVPVHAVGLQSHLVATRRNPPSWKKLGCFLDRLRKLDIEAYMTELDVNDRALTGFSTAERDRMVAKFYGCYLRGALAHPQVKAVLTWRLCDSDSWLIKRGAKRPLPFDSKLRPKEAYRTICEALANGRAR